MPAPRAGGNGRAQVVRAVLSPNLQGMIPRNHPDDQSLGEQKSDRTHEVTGADAPRDDAETGSAGNGASAFGADLTGVGSPAPEYEDEYHLERDPSDAEDIAPDKVEKGYEEPDAEDREITARPSEEYRPITADELPSDDPGAREGK